MQSNTLHMAPEGQAGVVNLSSQQGEKGDYSFQDGYVPSKEEAGEANNISLAGAVGKGMQKYSDNMKEQVVGEYESEAERKKADMERITYRKPDEREAWNKRDEDLLKLDNVVAATIIGLAGGAIGGPISALSGGVTGFLGGLYSDPPEWLREYKKKQKQTTLVPIIENMTPEEIARHYGG